MKFERMIWQLLVLPALIAGLLSGGCAFCFSHSLMVSGFALIGCICTMLGIAWMIERQQRTASALLRNPELRDLAGNSLGIYSVVLREMIAQVTSLEATARSSNQMKMESEARLHVRQKQSRRLEAALHSLTEPIVITDVRGQAVSWNTAAGELFRKVAKAKGGADAKAVDAPDLAGIPEVQTLLADAIARSAAASCRTCELETKIDDAAHTYRVTANNLRDDDGAELGVCISLRDIGREKQEKTRHAEFVSSVCHELKTPMASIRAFVEMLIDGDIEDHDEQLRTFGFIEMQIDRLTRLVNNMLNLARIESGVINIQREDCGLNEILEKALQVVGPVAQDKQITVIPELSNLYLPVHVDRDLLGQAVINLLSNAIKYTPSGGEVRLRSRMVDGEAIIDVRDNGMGIPEEDIGRLFQRFFRVAQNNKAAEGTGLGLALVQYIVHSVHNGRVTVESKVNEGSCFSASLPLGHFNKGRRKTEASACLV